MKSVEKWSSVAARDTVGSMKSALHIILWIFFVALGVFGLLTMTGLLETSGMDPAGRAIAQGIGFLICLVAAGAIVALLLARRWRAWLWVAGAIIALPFVLVVVFTVGKSIDEAKNKRESEDVHSGRADFREQPALLEVAEAISNNDEAAIRAAAKNVPDLNAAGREGKTLLYFAIDEALERPQLIKAVETLLSLGADPNYNNGQMNSFAVWRAAQGEVRLLRTMLDGGGNPNAPDFRGNPIIFGNWNTTYAEADRPARFRLLLDRGADVNSVLPDDSPFSQGYTLLLQRASTGRGDPSAYSDALMLLERGADFRRAAGDGTTLAKMLEEHRHYFETTGQEVPEEFSKLVKWLEEHGGMQSEPH